MYQHFMLNINKKVPHYVLMKKNNKSAAGMQHTPPRDTTFQYQLLYPV